MSEKKIYIKCREVSTTDKNIDETLSRDVEDSVLLSFIQGSTNGSIIVASFGVFFMLAIYFIGKYIFKSRPQTIHNKLKEDNAAKGNTRTS